MRINAVCEKVKQLAVKLTEKGYFLQNFEPLKLVLEGAKMGITGYELAEFLREGGIEPEFADADHLVLMFSTETKEEEFERIDFAFPPIIAMVTQERGTALPFRGEQIMSIREAMFARRCTIGVDHALGRICATPAVSCPPAIPIAISGERITQEMIQLFFLYGVEEIDVVEEE